MKTIRVVMFPNPLTMDKKFVSGIHTVIRAYEKVFPKYGMEFVDTDAECDVIITHAGMASSYSDIAMLHGIYFTDDYIANQNEWRANVHVVKSARRARFITVPSEWVAHTIRRDFRREPIIVPHGIFAEDWTHDKEIVPKSVLWAKNRDYDVCDPTALAVIAQHVPEFNFVTTFYTGEPPENVNVIGVQSTERIKTFVQKSEMVISTVAETWGILYAEAMAAGTPVVTANWGNVPNLSPHGVSGYTYNRNNTQDAIDGIRWVSKYRDVLSQNARTLAQDMIWDTAAQRVREMAEVIMFERNKGLL